MPRARLPLAVMSIAAGLAILPATGASAASSPLDGSQLGSVVSQIQGGLSGASGNGSSGSGSSSSTDPSTALSTFASCLQDAPNAKDTSTTTPTTNGDTSSSGTNSSSSASNPSTSGATQQSKTANSGSNASTTQGSSDQSLPTTGAPKGAIVGQGATIPDPLSPILTAGQKCVTDLFTALGAPQGQCFLDNGFTPSAVSAQVRSLLSGTTPDPSTLSTNLTGLLACLQGPSTPAANTGGGGATADAATPTPTPTGTEAPAAVAVTGTPNFTG